VISPKAKIALYHFGDHVRYYLDLVVHRFAMLNPLWPRKAIQHHRIFMWSIGFCGLLYGVCGKREYIIFRRIQRGELDWSDLASEMEKRALPARTPVEHPLARMPQAASASPEAKAQLE